MKEYEEAGTPSRLALGPAQSSAALRLVAVGPGRRVISGLCCFPRRGPAVSQMESCLAGSQRPVRPAQCSGKNELTR